MGPPLDRTAWLPRALALTIAMVASLLLAGSAFAHPVAVPIPHAGGGHGASAAANPRFQDGQLPVNPVKLFDLSVADVDTDGNLDLFSVNHKFRGSLLLGDGGGGFDTLLDHSGLSATSHIPGFDDLYRKPEIGPNGLYMWVDRDAVTNIRTKGLGTGPAVPSARVSGELRFEGRDSRLVTIQKQAGARVSMRTERQARGKPPTQVVEFDAGPNALIKIRARFMDMPFATSIDPDFKRSRILLGHRRSHPPDNSFRIDLGDRHGVAWADFDGDTHVDAYIANGGVRGAIRRLPDLATDELYFGNGSGHYTEDLERTGIDNVSKGVCRGRHAAPVDYDADGDLDIFAGCEKSAPLLLMQRKPGKFGSQSHVLQDVNAKGDVLRWVNLDGRGSPELITTFEGKLFVYRYHSRVNRYVQIQKKRLRDYGRNGNTIAIADVDGDKDPDAYIGSRGRNYLLLNGERIGRGKLKPVPPQKWGLPARHTIAGSFVDYDNDGKLDFHSAPHGMFERKGKRRFKQTRDVELGARADWASSQWVDYDSDGDRDLVSMLKRKSKTLLKKTFVNRTQSGNWLHVDLVGATGNREAIGGRVTVGQGKNAQTGFVGQSEGSRFSSGHYRLYFGVGKKRALPVRVRWPDGTESKLDAVGVNQRLEIRHPEAGSES